MIEKTRSAFRDFRHHLTDVGMLGAIIFGVVDLGHAALDHESWFSLPEKGYVPSVSLNDLENSISEGPLKFNWQMLPWMLVSGYAAERVGKAFAGGGGGHH